MLENMYYTKSRVALVLAEAVIRRERSTNQKNKERTNAHVIPELTV